MKDVRIVIVSWNVEKLLDRCLRSLPAACTGLDWDCVVVDNVSKDGSVAVAKDVPNVRVIANQDNRGFAKACNQGMVGSDARYVLLLNPDTECPPGSLAGFIREADKHPKAGILGSKLLNSDGSTQTSIRRFPSFWSQLGIMLKIQNVFPGAFRHYFASDLSLDVEQDVDQVMGSCFLIRRELLDQVGGLDERYFIWFEEVDYCRMAHERGWTVRYLPSVHISHHGGQSFGHVFSLQKQRYFNTSLVTYFRKWQPGWRPAVLHVFEPISLALAWVTGVLGLAGRGSRQVLSQQGSHDGGIRWKGWVVAVLMLEAVSLATIFHPKPNSVATVLVALIVGFLAWKRPTLALSALLMELMIGSKGYLLQLGAWPNATSLRIVLFVVFMLGWALNVTQARRWTSLPRLFKDRIEWLLLFIVVGYATLRGMSLGNEFVTVDGNAWGFLLLIIPVLDIASRMGERLRRDVLPVLVIAPVWLAVKTIGLEYVFSHGFTSIADPVYLWVRRTGVGEVTLIAANGFRIFMQSFIFALPALFFCASKYFATHDKGGKALRVTDLVVVSSLVVLGISLSRSMWIGTATGFVALLWMYRKSIGQVVKGTGRLIIAGLVACIVIFITLAFPIPHVDVASLATLFGSRISTEDAASKSRWKLFPVVWEKIKEHPVLGSGFGATVTYQTSDPRIVEQTGGTYTTYAIEWGWMDHWIKFGIIGFALMIALVYRIGVRVSRLTEPRWIVAASVATVVGLAATHFFTPYLNHPLGFGMLFALEALAISSKKG